MLDDGVYDLTLSTAEPGGVIARTEALAILRGGLVVGSDPHGGVFRGRYRYDASCGKAFVELRLAIPPNGMLLTGFEAGPDGGSLDICTAFVPARPVSSVGVEIEGKVLDVELRYVGALSA